MSRLRFQIQGEAAGSSARAALFHTLHGEVETPLFMPVGTQATVKSQPVENLHRAGSRILLANTYHLLLRPGPEVFRKFGGIHRFMNWSGPVLTDSGGFQIFSLPHSREMNEEGARFQSYVDGRSYLLSPEESIRTQRAIGSDIMMVLDQCIPSTSNYSQAEAAMHLTHRWAQRSLAAREDSPQSLFGIVQGACFHDLRKKSVDYLTALPFDGFAIGGLAVGETRDLREEFTALTASLLPRHLPRYLMGVGTPIDILEAVHRGVDLFDCILPTALAQRGVAFTTVGKLQLRRSIYKFAEESLDPACHCNTCQNYSRAYLHHLIKSEEVLGWYLLGNHNLHFYHQLMREIRQTILQGTFYDFYLKKRLELVRADEAYPVTPPQKSKTRVMRLSRLGHYEVQSSPQGYASIKHTASGEVMHSVSDPTVEANLLYIDQSQLRLRLNDLKDQQRLVIWDVGLGAATNAMAVIRCFETQCAERSSSSQNQNPLKIRPLHLVSFERDLDPLRLASKNAWRFPHLRHGAPTQILEEKKWVHPSGLLEWELIEGDFRESMETAAVPDLIFYDPFSYKTNPELWTPAIFSRLSRHCHLSPSSSLSPSPSTELYTYSASTAVRAALLAAGFFVARGVGSGPKAETTLAMLGTLRHPGELLGEEWLQRWEKSDAKFPPNLTGDEKDSFEKMIRNHPQFSLNSVKKMTFDFQ